MKLPGRDLLLKMLASTAIVILVYAVAVTSRTVLFGVDGGFLAILLFAVMIIVGHLAGWVFLGNVPEFASNLTGSRFIKFLSFMLHIKDGTNFITTMAAWSAILLPLLATLLIYKGYSIWRLLFELLLTMIAYIISLRYSSFSSIQILHNTVAYIGFTLLAVCLEVSYFMSRLTYLRPWLFVISYFFIFAYLIIKNQEDIDSNIFDKRHVEKSILPKNLRRFNMLSVCFLFLAILLFFNFKSIIIYILQLLGKLTIQIIRGILWLMDHLFHTEGTLGQSGAAPQNFEFFGEAAELIDPFKNLLFNTLRNFIILYVIYRILFFLVKKIPGLVHKVIEWLKKLFSINMGDKPFETMDYCDETETLRPAQIHDNLRRLKKNMRKSRRDLKNISDPVERIRHMYSSILHMLPLLGVQPFQSDTTSDILRKTALKGEILKELVPYTAIYNQVRYGERVPDKVMLTEAEGHFSKAVVVIGQK